MLSEVIGLIVAAYIIYAVTSWLVLAMTTVLAVGCVVALIKIFR